MLKFHHTFINLLADWQMDNGQLVQFNQRPKYV